MDAPQNGPSGPQMRFAARLITPRTLMIFAAGFGLALLLARILPDSSLFHPEGRVITVDTIITGTNDPGFGQITAIGVATNQSFSVHDGVWDGTLLDQVKEKAPGPMRIAARITYVVPREGSVSVVAIRQPT